MSDRLILEETETMTLFREEERLILDVSKPPVRLLDLLALLRRHGTSGPSTERLRELANVGGVESLTVGAGRDLSEPSLQIVDGGLEATLSLPPDFDDEEALRKLFAARSVVYGLDGEALARALERSRSGQAVRDVVVARGLEPRHGENGWVEHLMRRPTGKPTMTESGEVDFYSLDLVVEVHRGDALAIRHEAKPPREGKTVTGQTLAGRSGRTPRLAYGRGAEMEGDRLVASVDGRLVWKGERLSVEPLLIVEGPVGPETGNIVYDGPVLVRGDVREGYSVTSGGDIDIQGGIERAVVRSGGSVSVRFGIVGKGGALVEAEGDILARFVQEAEVRCSLLKVNEYVLRSKIHARKGVLVEGSRGVIMASQIEAAAHVNARSVRVMRWGDTSISVTGVSRLELFQRCQALGREIVEADDELLVLSSSIRTLTEKGFHLQARKRLAEFLTLEEAQEKRKEELAGMKETLRNLRGDASFSVIDGVSGEISLRLKGVSCRVNDKARRVTLYYDPDEGQVRIAGRE